MQSRSPLDNLVANELTRHAPAIAQEWVRHIERDDREAAASEELVTDLRHHGPELVKSIVEFMREPSDVSRADLVARLRLHADRRLARGYDIHQLLADFEHLSKLFFTSFADAVEQYAVGVTQPREVAELAGRLHEALTEMTSDTVGMYRQAELEQRRALARKLADFTRVVMHELKNPLGAARSGTEMLQDATVVKTSDDRDRFIRLILRNLLRIQGLLHDIQTLALAEDHDRVERWTPLDVLIRRTLDELRPEAASKGVRLAVAGTLPTTPVDATRLDIALTNLIGNAIKYSDQGKEQPCVVIQARPTANRQKKHRVQIEIRDNGLGIPLELQGSVFKRHFRAHTHVAAGTGLGLAIASELVADAGGRIWFTSDEGRGTTYFIELPDDGGRQERERREADLDVSLSRPTVAAAAL